LTKWLSALADPLPQARLLPDDDGPTIVYFARRGTSLPPP
jgi:hypothetical protein